LGPLGRVRVASENVLGNGEALKVPDGDGVGGPFGGVDSAAYAVEAVTVGGGVAGGNGTAHVASLSRRVDVTVGCFDDSVECRRVCDAASRACV
jgi:hypothetical protein